MKAALQGRDFPHELRIGAHAAAAVGEADDAFPVRSAAVLQPHGNRHAGVCACALPDQRFQF